MSGKRDLVRENEMRRLATRKKNADKVIIGYIKTKYPSVYGEAAKYLQELNAEYPDKKDLSKTKTFQHMLRTKATSENHRVRSKVVKMDSFRLQIALDEYTKTANPPAQDSPAEVTLQTSRAEMAKTNTLAELEYTKTANPPAQDTPAEVTLQTSRAEMAKTNTLAELATAAVTAPDPQDATLSLMDQGTLEEIMNDLREDPTIANFFSDMEHQLDNCPLW